MEPTPIQGPPKARAAPGGSPKTRKVPTYGFLFARLLVSLLAELLSTVVHMAAFLFRRRAVREEMRSVILGRKGAAVSVLAGSLLLAALSGCACGDKSRMGTSQPGSSFVRQWEEVGDSIYRLAEMKDWRDSLVSDLEDLFTDDPCQLVETFELWGW